MRDVVALLLCAAPWFAPVARADATVRWLPPTADDLAGYMIYLGAEPQAFEAAYDIGYVSPDTDGVASYDLDALVSDGAWYVAMTAYDQDANESTLSNQILVPVGPPPECAVDLDCGDADACNGAERCVDGACAAGSPPVCAAPDACHVARCDAVSGCGFDARPDGTACDDGDPATEDDACFGGICAGVLPLPPEPDPFELCLDFYESPHAVRLALSRSEPGAEPSVTAVWDAPLREEGALLRYRAVGDEGWDQVWADPRSTSGCVAHYAAPLAGLDPQRSYEYTVSGETAVGFEWSPTARFTTPPAASGDYAPAGVAFFAGNGLDGSARSPVARRVVELVRALRPHALLGGGGYAHAIDAIETGLADEADHAVDLWLEQLSAGARGSPFLPVYGAPEATDGVPGEAQAAYRALHPTPDGDGPEGSYAFDLGLAHFVALNAPDAAALDPEATRGAALLAWLAADLADARARGARFIVVYTHVDPYSSEAGGGLEAGLRDRLAGLFEEHGVSLVLSGAGRSFERSFPLRGGRFDASARTVFLGDEGVIYLRSGAGGRVDFGRWAAGSPPEWSAARDNTMGTLVFLRLLGAHYLIVATVGVPVDGGPFRALDVFAIR